MEISWGVVISRQMKGRRGWRSKGSLTQRFLPNRFEWFLSGLCQLPLSLVLTSVRQEKKNGMSAVVLLGQRTGKYQQYATKPVAPGEHALSFFELWFSLA